MKIIHWTIKITLENGETEFLSDAPDWVAKPVDEYLNALEMNKRDIDVCTLIPHAALRVYVMGDRALAHEKATDDDMVKMRKISFEAIKAGAFGFSTSRTISHTTVKIEE